tara:strand:- start:36 stop:491 length:456 start_codon:yes stop_codon:yes gene_type:complete
MEEKRNLIKMDKRKNNGNNGHSTRSNKKYDKRRKGNFEGEKYIDEFLNKIIIQVKDFYKFKLRKEIKEITLDGFYVYKHTVDNEVVYIGKGSGDRMYSINRTSGEHTKIIKDGGVNFKIISNGMTNEIALILEKELIKFYQPVFNKQNILK